MAKTRNSVPLGRDEENHCKVIMTRIDRGDLSAVKEFTDSYSKRKQRSILEKWVPNKDLRKTYIEHIRLHTNMRRSLNLNDSLRH